MASRLLRAACAFAATAALTGCHARWFPLSSPPPYHYRAQSQDGTLNKVVKGQLSDEDNGYAMGFRYEVPAKGALLLTAKPSIPSAQLDLDVYGDGTIPVATTKDNPDKKLQVQDLEAGTYYVIVREPWKDAIKTAFQLNTVFKPTDPEQANGPFKSQAGARELPADRGLVEDTVDYSNMRRTNFWKVSLPGEGGLIVKFNKDPNAKIKAEIIPPAGAPEPIDPTVGYKKDDLPAGDYYVKVYAEDAGDAGKYSLGTTFKAGDTCKNGGPSCSIEGAEDLKLPSDSKTADVDYTKSKQFRFYKATVKEKGKLTIAFKVLNPPRGSKVAAFFLRQPDDDGEKIIGTSSTKELEAGEYWIKIAAPDAGDYGKFALQTIWSPNNFIAADVVEIGKPCMLTVSAGTNQGVRSGAAATIVAAGGQAIDSGVVDQAFPNLSKVRPLSAGCKIPTNGAKVQIAAQ